jgi:hypothetical protein
VVEEFIMLDKYIESARRASTHPAKLTVLSELLREIFTPANPIHKRLAELSKICHDKVAGIKLANKSVAGKRKKVREILKGEIEEINNIVSQLLNLG